MDNQKISYIHPNFTDNIEDLWILRLDGNPCLCYGYGNQYYVPSVLKKLEKCYENYDQLEDESSVCDLPSVEVLNAISEDDEVLGVLDCNLEKDENQPEVIDEVAIMERDQIFYLTAAIFIVSTLTVMILLSLCMKKFK
jgi:hypothetical protein